MREYSCNKKGDCSKGIPVASYVFQFGIAAVLEVLQIDQYGGLKLDSRIDGCRVGARRVCGEYKSRRWKSTIRKGKRSGRGGERKKTAMTRNIDSA